jgi:hypothetical protein
MEAKAYTLVEVISSGGANGKQSGGRGVAWSGPRFVPLHTQLFSLWGGRAQSTKVSASRAATCLTRSVSNHRDDVMRSAVQDAQGMSQGMCNVPTHRKELMGVSLPWTPMPVPV